MSRLYKGKWDGIANRQKYEDFRDKIRDEFTGLTFIEESHQYFLGNRELACVSNVIHMFQEDFNTDEMAEGTYERNFDNPNSKYYRKTVEDIKQMWNDINNEATTRGTARHNFGESCFHFMLGEEWGILPEFKDRVHIDKANGLEYIESIYPQEDAVVAFWNDLPKSYIPILAENKVYDVNESFAYSGTFDILFYYDPSVDGRAGKEGFIIFDYKTNKDLYKSFNQNKLLPPFNELIDMPLNIYKLQLSAYQNCLQKIGFNVIGRRLIWLLKDSTYSKIAIEEYVDRLVRALRVNGTEQCIHRH